jgi:hypothetical protein
VPIPQKSAEKNAKDQEEYEYYDEEDGGDG